MNITRKQFFARAAAALPAAAALRSVVAEPAPGDRVLSVDGLTLPDWAVRQIEDGAARYAAWKGGDEAVTFPLLTDLHAHTRVDLAKPDWNHHMASVLLQRAIAERVGSDFLANLGDLDFDVNILGTAPDFSKVQTVIDGYRDVYRREKRPVLFAMGNHDHAKKRYTSAQFGEAFNRSLNDGKDVRPQLDADGTWGILDLPAKKFRAVFLNTSDEGYLGFSVRQLQYLADRLADAPAGWSVAVLQHANVPHFISKWRRFGDSNGSLLREELEQTIVEDFANARGGLVEGFHNPPVLGQLGGVRFDYAGTKAALAGVFQGHLHAESYLKYAKVNYVIRPGYGTIPADCACGEWRDAKRCLGAKGTVPRGWMMVDLVAVKPALRRVHVFRFGWGGPESELDYGY